MKFCKELRVQWPVTVPVPTDGGVSMPASFTATFVVMNPDPILSGGSDQAALERFLVGWEGITGEDEQPLPFTPENVAAVTGLPYIRFAIFNAWQEACLGRGRAKN